MLKPRQTSDSTEARYRVICNETLYIVQEGLKAAHVDYYHYGAPSGTPGDSMDKDIKYLVVAVDEDGKKTLTRVKSILIATEVARKFVRGGYPWMKVKMA